MGPWEVPLGLAGPALSASASAAEQNLANRA